MAEALGRGRRRNGFSPPQVRSFGTEDRPTDRPAPPREEIYEYIIFRGSDIKDITVCEPPKAQHTLPQDPAIVQVSAGLGCCAGTLPAALRWVSGHPSGQGAQLGGLSVGSCRTFVWAVGVEV